MGFASLGGFHSGRRRSVMRGEMLGSRCLLEERDEGLRWVLSGDSV